MTERRVLYARVSTTEQASDGKGSIPYQLEECERYATAHGWNVVGSFSDEISPLHPLYGESLVCTVP